MENKLLKQLVQTLQDKNELLNKLLSQEKEKNNKNGNQAWVTYANVLTQSNIKPKTRKVPKLIIKKTNSKDETNIVKTMCNYLTNDKTVQAKNVNTKIKDTVIINCMNIENVEKIEKNLKSSLNENFKVEIEQINKSTMKIIGIDKQLTTKEEVEADINQRNFSNVDEKCKVLHIFTNQNQTKNKIVQ